MDDIKNVLYEVMETLAQNSKKNMDIVDKVQKILSNLKDPGENYSNNENPGNTGDNELIEHEIIEKTIEPDLLLNDNSDIMERRIEHHKKMGTFSEPPPEEVKKPVQNSDPQYPKVSPLMKLSPRQRDQLYRTIFNEAKNNVEVILNIKRDSEDYAKKLNEESDRILNNWMEMNK